MTNEYEEALNKYEEAKWRMNTSANSDWYKDEVENAKAVLDIAYNNKSLKEENERLKAKLKDFENK